MQQDQIDKTVKIASRIAYAAIAVAVLLTIISAVMYWYYDNEEAAHNILDCVGFLIILITLMFIAALVYLLSYAVKDLKEDAESQ